MPPEEKAAAAAAAAVQGSRKFPLPKAAIIGPRLLPQPPLPLLLAFLLLSFILLPGVALAEDFGPISPLTRFDAKGQLPQSDAAARAVARGGPLIALSLKEAVLLVAPR